MSRDGGEGERDVDPEKRATLRRFAALGAATPLSRFAGTASADGDGPTASDSDTRDALVGYVGATPGAHFSRVRDDLKLGTGETQYHLRELENAGTVESRKDGDYRRYFLAGQFDEFQQVALGYLRRETPRRMVVELLRDPEASAATIADRLGVSRPTVSNHAADLERAGILTREDGYALAEPEAVLVLLVRYADSFGREAAALASEAPDLLTHDA
jgi:predicted transcriptional regulator